MQRMQHRAAQQIASSSRSVRCASSSPPLPISLEQASAQLIPPIPLYRRLLRVHRYLPDDMRFMGDSYIKSEFRLTRKTDNPMHVIAFLTQWKKYLDEIEGSIPPSKPGANVKKREIKWTGRKLDTAALDKLSEEQVGQLYELMHATKDIWKTSEQLEACAKESEETKRE